MTQMLVAILKWPVVSLLITGALHFTIEAVWPDLKNFFIPPVLTPVLLAYGAWVGYRTIQLGGNYVQVIIGGVILGILPLVLDIVGFGLVLGRGVAAMQLAGIFGFAVIVFGSLLGGGFALSAKEKAAA